MNNAKYIVTWICLLWLTIGSCVDKFNAHLPESSTRVLIVEGNIISDSTVVFSLSCSFPLNVEGIPQDYNKIDAEVSVVGSDGSCFNGTSLGDGKYQVVIGSLNKDASYSLKIVYEGDIYTSEPQYPLETETIDDVTYEQPEKYGDISIRFSMRSEDGGCYFWSYEEDWEVRAVYNPKFRYDPTTDEVVDFDATPYARGWCHNKSAKIIVGNTGTNKDAQLKDKWLYSIKADNNRVFHHYSTLVKQRKISRGEYEYYQEKIKINEEMGGLFIPQPSELPTNITCNNSDKNVVGYVGVSMNVAKYSLAISEKLHIPCEKKDLIRGALLHDYFLYDWHTPDHISPHKLHGFYHPGRALHNAQKEYHLTPREKDIIKKHMWPLTISAVPMCREAWIVTMADKWCSLMETFHVHKGHGALIEKLRKIEEEQGK